MIPVDEIIVYKKSGEPAFDTTRRSRTAVLIRRLIGEAIEMRATDLHIEPEEAVVRIRARVDGFLRDLSELDREAGAKVISAVKVICDLDITRKSRMQDGSFSAMVQGKLVEFRVSSVEEINGDNVVIRVLETQPDIVDLHRIGLPSQTEQELRDYILSPQGLLLVSGPTGSGKSTTLYSMLREVDRKQRNVVAIEDPIEFHLDYVTQIAVDAKHGITFASALRNALRQDPNILMVGEIRDPETAAIAIQSGLTGHLVFSTVHARDAVATIYRLLDLGVEPFLVANVLNFSLAQRLVRLLCRECRHRVKVDRARIEKSIPGFDGPLYGPVGCPSCENTGYRGRTGIFEIVRITESVRDLIIKKAPEDTIRKAAIADGSIPIQRAAMEKVAAGLTSIQEIERVLGA